MMPNNSRATDMADFPGESTLNDEGKASDPPSIAASRPSERIDQIDIARAEEEFYALSHQLTARAEAAEKASVATRAGKDSEKGDNALQAFDLREYLTSSNDANQNAGIKHKVGSVFNMFRSRWYDTCRAARWCDMGRHRS